MNKEREIKRPSDDKPAKPVRDKQVDRREQESNEPDVEKSNVKPGVRPEIQNPLMHESY